MATVQYITSVVICLR